MRIGQLIDAYKPTINGVIHSVSLHKRILELWGHEVYVFTMGNEEYEDDEPNVIRSPAIPISDTGYHLSFRYSRRALKLAEEMDVLHVHHPFIAGLQATRITERTRVPIIFTNHTRYHLQARYYLSFVPEELADSFLRTYMARFTTQCDLVVVPSGGVAQWLREFGVEAQIDVIPNGVEVERIAHPPAPIAKDDLGLPTEACVAMTVGRLGLDKNLEFMLRAFSRAAVGAPGLHLVLVGDGPARESLEEFACWSGAGDRIHFVGAVPYEEVPNWLAAADFFVMTSTAESHPLSVLEGLAAGLPILGIPSPGIEDSVVDKVNGLLCPEDVDAFAHHMLRLALDEELRARLTEGACHSRCRFDIRRTSARLMLHYERLVEECRRRSYE